MAFECNLRANRIGKITITKGDLYKFKLALNEATGRYEVKSNKDGFVWGEGASTKGAVIGACRQGIQLKDINLSGGYVPIKEVIEAIKG